MKAADESGLSSADLERGRLAWIPQVITGSLNVGEKAEESDDDRSAGSEK